MTNTNRQNSVDLSPVLRITGTSSSPPLQALSMPPSWERYASKRLPELPKSSGSPSPSSSAAAPERPCRSAFSSFRSEHHQGSDMPKASMNKRPHDFSRKKEESYNAVSLRTHIGPPPSFHPFPTQSHPAVAPAELGTAQVPGAPREKIDPLHQRRPVPKIQCLDVGHVRPTDSPCSPRAPSGHQSSQKIRQLTGLDLCADIPSSVGGAATFTDHEMSPLSPSSVYSEHLSERSSESCLEQESRDTAEQGWNGTSSKQASDVCVQSDHPCWIPSRGIFNGLISEGVHVQKPSGRHNHTVVNSMNKPLPALPSARPCMAQTARDEDSCSSRSSKDRPAYDIPQADVGTMIRRAGIQLRRAGGQLRGLAEEARRSVGRQSLQERRRADLKGQIRVISPVAAMLGVGDRRQAPSAADGNGMRGNWL